MREYHACARIVAQEREYEILRVFTGRDLREFQQEWEETK